MATQGEQANDDLDMLLDYWRGEQKQAGEGGGEASVRFVLEFAGSDKAEGPSLTGDLKERLALRCEVEPLFPEGEAEARFYLVSIPDASRPDRADLFEMAALLRRITGADVVEPDLGTDYFECEAAERPASGTPESADSAAWCWAGAADSPEDRDWAVATVKVGEAWAYSRAKQRPADGEGILVFQPDTGIVARHVELPEGLHAHSKAANFVERGSAQALDPARRGNAGHGTGTASVVISPTAGRMKGVAPAATLVPIRCVERVAVFDQSRVAQAIEHARRQGAHVITMSIGGVMSRALHEAVRRAVRDNVILVAAAGNCIGTVVWPARYEEAIAVGGINSALKAWRGSSSGPAVDFSGPAEFVLRANGLHPGDGDECATGGQGTSFATAITAGVAALWLAHHGRDELIRLLPRGRTLQDMFRALVQKSATTVAGLDPDEFGAGVVNARALLEADPATAFAGVESAGSTRSVEADLTAMIADAFGSAGLETVGPAIVDEQHEAELACMALDRLRARRTLRAHVEALPPPALSPSLRARFAGDVASLRS